MSPYPAILWCRVLKRPVNVVLAPAEPGETSKPLIPPGWVVRECLDENEKECDHQKCPLIGLPGEDLSG